MITKQQYVVPNSEREVDAWGRVIINADAVFDLLYKGIDVNGLLVREDRLVEEYNQHCREFDKTEFALEIPHDPDHSPEEEHAARTQRWMIPESYRTFDVRNVLLSRCSTDTERVRVNMEMDLFEERELIPLLRLMFYLVDYFRENNVVWGVGRGSSVASYCLFLIGVHKIDSLRFDLNFREFLK